MNMSVTANKIINFSERDNLFFIIKECDFSLFQIVRRTYSAFCREFKNIENKNNVIEIPLSFVFKEALCAENLNKPIKTNNIIIKPHSTIKNVCNCLEAIAKINGNRFIFKILDVCLFCNKELFSRLILNLCYQLLMNCNKYSAIEIISYLEPEQYIIEVTTEMFLTDKIKVAFSTLTPILKQLKSDFSYEKLPNQEITFKISMPYENIRF